MSEILFFTEQVARQAGDLLTKYFQHHGMQATVKADLSVVTEADVAADHLITQAIQERFPEDGLLSEELRPGSKASQKIIWVIDPLDGTTNFSLGLPIWGISIARIVEGWPETAALFFPITGEMYTAQKGAGAYLNGERIHVKPPHKDQTATFFACCSRTHTRYQVSIPYKPRILGSTVYNLCMVARGAAVLGFDASPKIWDLAGGWLLVEEAGGVIEPLSGDNPFPLSARINYSQKSFPTLAAATRQLASKAHTKILPNQVDPAS